MVMFTGVSCSIRGLYLYGYINVILISKVASLLLLFIFVLIFNVVRWTRQCPPGRICQWFLTPRPWVFLPGPDFEEKGLLRWVQPGRPTTRLVVSCCWPFGVSHPLEREACRRNTFRCRTGFEKTSAKKEALVTRTSALALGRLMARNLFLSH